jgi:hypothetical protein
VALRARPARGGGRRGRDRRAVGAPYTWTISADPFDPYQNTTPFVPGLRTFYLHYACSTPPPTGPGGAAAAEFGVYNTNLANSVVGFIPLAGFLNAGTPTELLLAIAGCPDGPRRAGNLLTLNAIEGQYCFRPSANGVMGTVDCSPNPDLWPMDFIGLSHGAGSPCFAGTGDCTKPISVEETSWGKVKTLYR